jgi:hypothetical protein
VPPWKFHVDGPTTTMIFTDNSSQLLHFAVQIPLPFPLSIHINVTATIMRPFHALYRQKFTGTIVCRWMIIMSLDHNTIPHYRMMGDGGSTRGYHPHVHGVSEAAGFARYRLVWIVLIRLLLRLVFQGRDTSGMTNHYQPQWGICCMPCIRAGCLRYLREPQVSNIHNLVDEWLWT